MADLTITISNAINLFGPADTSLYGTAVYGTDLYGTDSDMEFAVDKLFSNTANVADALTFEADKLTANSVSVSPDIATITRQDAAGFIYVFPSNQLNGANIPSGVFSQIAIGSDAFTTLPANSTTWEQI
jgi:hypothetical protein